MYVLNTQLFSVAKLINIFEKFQCYGVQIINKYLLSSLPNLKVNISHDINLVLGPNIYNVKATIMVTLLILALVI